MKKLVTGIAIIAIIFSVAITTVSAETYEVKKGDNLWTIAEEYNTTMKKLMEINGFESTLIHPEQTIIINETYTVEKGDTLTAISKKLDVTVKEIVEWNDLKSTLILIGQELVIKDSQIESEDKMVASRAKVSKQDANRPAKEPAAPVAKSKPQAKKETSSQPEGKTMTMKATAYTAECDGCSGVTYTGVDLNKDRNAKVIAVDPSVIPLGTEVYVEGYGYAVAEDIGSAIKGNRIDIHVPTKKEAYTWGVKNVTVTIIK